VVDSSVVVKWLFDEPRSDIALGLLNGRQHEFHAPDLFLLEVINVVNKRVRRNLLPLADAIPVCESIPMLPIRRHPFHQELKAAFEVATRTGMSVYDAVFLALAVRLDVRFVTDDERALQSMMSSEYGRYPKRLRDFQP